MLAELHPHPRDALISFEEEGHRYTIAGVGEQPISTTTFIHTFFEEFDADRVITSMMASRNWPNSRYFGMSREEIKQQWEDNRVEASTAGTRMHKSIEDFLNLPDEARYQACTYFAEYGAVPRSLPQTDEFRMFMEFWRYVIDSTTMRPYRTEWLVYDAPKRLAGSIDLVMRDADTGDYIIADWKRSKEIKKGNPWRNGRLCLSHLPDCNYTHYSLQLNIYRHLLETLYGARVVRMFLVVLHPNNAGYEIHDIERMEREVNEMLKLLPMPVPHSAEPPAGGGGVDREAQK